METTYATGLFQKLYERGVKLVTGIKNGMKNILMDFGEKILMRKRSLALWGYQLTDNKPQVKGLCGALV
jgi:hypothetical protein